MDKLTERVWSALDLLDKRSPSCSELEHIANKLGCKLRSGATRWAFVFVKERIVYKFPRYGSVSTDYCALELANYNLGKKYRIEKCLLPIALVGELPCGLPIYTQPMYDRPHEALGWQDEEKLRERLGQLHNSPIVRKVQNGCYSCPQRLWIERAIQIYGKAFMRSFEKWSREGQVNDLHGGNVGWLGKQPIIIDYAGYHG